MRGYVNGKMVLDGRNPKALEKQYKTHSTMEFRSLEPRNLSQELDWSRIMTMLYLELFLDRSKLLAV